ncbi:putative integral membrane protein [Cryptosporidium hominis]|nr:hypothetical protein ChTU502y2012_407g1650 [Cryptosporidium hominis]PPA64038.1 putative integral membrane protein [Cryptosporidium hominis]
MDLSLQSFLSTQFLSKISDKIDNPIVIGADYHGSVSPCELDFHPLISSNVFIERSIDKNNTNCFQVINNSPIVLPLTDNKNIQIFESKKYKTENIGGCDSALFKRMDVNLVNKQNEINNENNYSTVLEPFHYGTKMVSTEFKNQNGNGYANDLILATKIFNPLQNYEINNKNINNQNIPTHLGKSISSNEIFYNHQYELRDTENTEFDLNSFRLYTYYTTHYLFQITSIFSMGISLHSQYRQALVNDAICNVASGIMVKEACSAVTNAACSTVGTVACQTAGDIACQAMGEAICQTTGNIASDAVCHTACQIASNTAGEAVCNIVSQISSDSVCATACQVASTVIGQSSSDMLAGFGAEITNSLISKSASSQIMAASAAANSVTISVTISTVMSILQVMISLFGMGFNLYTHIRSLNARRPYYVR